MIWIWYFYFVLERIKSSAKFNDFGERIRIRDLFLCKMLDFAGVLGNFEIWFFCWMWDYFDVKLIIFDWVRENAYFIRVWGRFMMWFWLFLVLWNVAKCLIFKGFVEVVTEVIFGNFLILDLELRVDVWVEHMGVKMKIVIIIKM